VASASRYGLAVRYLITGGAGFIGSHLAEALIERGDDVVALDNLATGREDNLSALRDHPSFRLVLGSILDELLVDELVDESDVVVHLGAAVGVRLIVEQPYKSLRTNIRGTEIVLDAAHRHRKKVFIASTSEVYGKASGKMHELADRVLGPPSVARWSYSASKAVDEHLALAYWRERQIPIVIARFFNTVGPRQTGAYGMVVPRLVAQALLDRPLTIYGDGKQTRCFCDVEDVVRAVMGLLDEPSATGDVFNVGSEEEVSILELAERIGEATGSKSEPTFISYEEVYGDQYEDMLRRVPDTSKIQGALGWTPRHDLNAIIKRTIGYAHEIGPENLLE
jgi:UDP-glucose 4-epimerase